MILFVISNVDVIETHLESISGGRRSVVTEKTSLKTGGAETHWSLNITLPGSSASDGEESVEVDGIVGSSLGTSTESSSVGNGGT